MYYEFRSLIFSYKFLRPSAVAIYSLNRVLSRGLSPISNGFSLVVSKVGLLFIIDIYVVEGDKHRIRRSVALTHQ